MHAAAAPPMESFRTARKLRVLVLAGGPGSERAVSEASGAAIAAALERRGHDVERRDITPSDQTALDAPADVVFPALHGEFGEDGALQELLEARRVRFVGSNSDVSRLCIDKLKTKARLGGLGLNLPSDQVVRRGTPVAAALANVTGPVIVKPPCEGSSVGVCIVHDGTALLEQVTAALVRYESVMVEQFIAGDEFAVGWLDGTALPPICIRPRRAFYDYEAKYVDEGTEYRLDSGTAEVHAALRRQTEAVCGVLGCRHLARADWIVDADGAPWLLEVNTMPGFTSHSLLPKAAAAAGLSLDDLVDRLVHLAVEEH